MILQDKNRTAFYFLFAICSGLLLILLKGFFNIIFFSLVFSIILNPFYKFFEKIPKINKYIASFLMLATIFVLSLLPLYYLSLSLYIEVVNFKNLATNYSIDQILYTAVDNINNYLRNSALGDSYLLNFYEVKNYLNQIYGALYNRLFGFIVSISQTSISFSIKFLFFIFFTFYFSANLKRIEELVIKYSLINHEHTKIFIKKFTDFVSAFVQGVIPVAIIQGCSAGLILLVLGVPNSFLLTILMIFLSLIPFLGSGLTMFIIAMLYFFNGDMSRAIIIIVWNLLIVTNIDNVFRTFFISKKTKLNPIMMFFSIAFGLSAFGLPGLFYGPIIVIFFNTCLSIYKDYLPIEN